MADFDTGDVVRLTTNQRFQTSYAIVNTWHLRIDSGGGLAFAAFSLDLQQYADALFNPLATVLSNAQTAYNLNVVNVTQGTVWPNFAWSSYTGGSGATDTLAPQVALLAFGRTQLPRVQIRKYLGVFTEAATTNGLFIGAIVSAGLALMTYHIAGQTMGGGSVLRGVAYNYALSRATYALTPACSSVPVIQRRRRLGRGA